MGECFLKDDFNDPTLTFHIIRPKEPEKYIKDAALSQKDMEDPNNFGSPEFSAWSVEFINRRKQLVQKVQQQARERL